MLSSDLAKILEKKYRVAAAAARKRVERGCEGMTKLSHVIFPHRARFVYLKSEYGSPWFFEKLMAALQKTNSTYYHALQALEMRSNVMPRSHFLIACGAPVAQKKHISAESLTERLLKANLVKEVSFPEGEICIVRCDKESTFLDSHLLAKMKARLIAERVALLAVKDWARNLGLVSYDAVQTREDEDLQAMPQVGTFQWDMAGPSYLFPMRSYTADTQVKPGFFVCDIALSGRVSAEEISAFVKKCVTLRSLPKVGRCLQVFVAEEYTPEAFTLLKSEGVIPASTESLFGVEVAKALKSLCLVLTNTASLLKNPGALEKIFDGLSRIEGAGSTLRGSLFEFVVAYIVKTTYPGCDPEVNRKVKDVLGRGAEIDVLVVRKNREVVFIECKGVHPLGTVDNDEVVKWLDIRIPVLREVAKHHSDWCDLYQRYEIWSSGGFTEHALSLIAERQQQSNKYKIEARNADYVHSQVRDSNDKGLIRTYEEHFINHPMLEFDKAQERAKRKAERDMQRAKYQKGSSSSKPPPLPQLLAQPTVPAKK
ncbi:hypothetical protein [Pseudomonas frederiksbergensis]|uniref:Uncharacterized protein n=1 Tax=Pseudomonas frederiksbergensis TaxID=104087 RepID=A0AB33EIV7_9PSED|nr:hypothetical protein [Pseudomonas frederiksbergensis]ATE80183.1 hypothetical protein CNN82_28635 [Pseudomonas frederiksbergensis]